MAKKRKGEKISLLPFLDIMTATMGTLILILISVTLISVTQESKKVYLKLKSSKEETGKKTPFYLVCEKDKIQILPSFQEISINELETENSPFLDFTNKLDRLNQYIIFAIRPTGIECFNKVRRIVESRGIDIGYEPVGRNWKIQVEKDAEEY